MTTLSTVMEDYYRQRGLKWPSFIEALLFVLTELGEVCELELSRVGGFVRNNPMDKPAYTDHELERELGDVIMMVQVAGMRRGLDPLTGLLDKLGEKVNRDYKQLLFWPEV